MPWVHEDLTTEAEVMKHFPTAKRYKGTDAGFNKFCEKTKWRSYEPFSKDIGGAAWRLENAGGPVKMYSKSAGPYSRGRAFTRNALTWFGDGMIQMSLPYHSGSHAAHEHMVPNGDDQNHKIRVVIQFWVSDDRKECVRFDLGWFRPVRKWNQGGFWKALLVRTGSELIENINSMIQTSQKEITELKKKHDKVVADKDEKIKELTEQVASLSTQNKKLQDELDETKRKLDETKRKLDALQSEHNALKSERDALQGELNEKQGELGALQSEHDALHSEMQSKLQVEEDDEDDEDDRPLSVILAEKKKDKELCSLRAKITRLEGELEETKGKLARKETELQKEKGHHEATKYHMDRLNCQIMHKLHDLPTPQEYERLMNPPKRGGGPYSGKAPAVKRVGGPSSSGKAKCSKR